MQALMFLLIIAITEFVKAEDKLVKIYPSETSQTYQFYQFDWDRKTLQDYKTKKFKVKASSNADIVFSPLPRVTDNMLQFIIGADNNSKSYMKVVTADLQSRTVAEASTPRVLDAGELRGFVVVAGAGRVALYREGARGGARGTRAALLRGCGAAGPYVGVRGPRADWLLQGTTPCCNIRPKIIQNCSVPMQSCFVENVPVKKCDFIWRWSEQQGSCVIRPWQPRCAGADHVFPDLQRCQRACSQTWQEPLDTDVYECQTTH